MGGRKYHCFLLEPREKITILSLQLSSMKSLRTLLICLTTITLTSCMELTDLIEIMENGSGKLSTTTDLAMMVDMMAAMGGEEFEKHKGEKVDTVFLIKDLVKNSKNLTAEQKELLADGTMAVKMDLANKEFHIRSGFRFANISRLQDLIHAKGLMPAIDETIPNLSGSGDNGAKNPDINILFTVFDYKTNRGSIVRTVNTERLKKLLEDKKLDDLKAGSDMGMEVVYKTVLNLPAAAKVSGHDNATLSVDKKTVTIRDNLFELFLKPEKFSFTVTY